MTAPRGRPALPAAVAGGIALVVGGAALFRFLTFVLEERFLPVLLGLLAVALVANVAFLILRRRRPELVGRLRVHLERQAASESRPLDPRTRCARAVLGTMAAGVAVAGGWVMWTVPDLGLLAVIWAIPAAYVAITALYVAASGRPSSGDGGILWLLWPW